MKWSCLHIKDKLSLPKLICALLYCFSDHLTETFDKCVFINADQALHFPWCLDFSVQQLNKRNNH